MRIFRNIYTSLHLVKVLSKYRILIDFAEISYLKKTRKIINFIFAPITFIMPPKRPFGARLNLTFQELGPVYIKLGQTLSTRPDFVGDKVARPLKKLQDNLPAFDSNLAIAKIKEVFKKDIKEIFAEFDEKPVAAASVAQVHKARLHSGEQVAVKFLRPTIKEQYVNDIKFLEDIASVLTKLFKKFARLKLKDVISVFKQSMQFELNLLSEGASAMEVKRNFYGDKDLYIPKIYWQYSAPEILTSEWIDGASIYDTEELESMGLDKTILAKKMAVIFFNMSYRDGFFHADLHPGNILVNKYGQIVLIDFGIIGILSEHDRLAVAEALYAFLKRDYQMVAEVHKKVGYIPADTNLENFAQSCRAVAEPIFASADGNISIGDLLAQLFQITEDYGMNTQPQLLLLQKTMVVVEGIGQSLDKDIVMWKEAEPWMKKWAAKNISPEAKFLRHLKKLVQSF